MIIGSVWACLDDFEGTCEPFHALGIAIYGTHLKFRLQSHTFHLDLCIYAEQP